MKKTYISPEMEIEKFSAPDNVCTVSGEDYNPDTEF